MAEVTILKPSYKGQKKAYMKVGKQVRSFHKSIENNWEKAFNRPVRNEDDIVCDSVNDLGRTWTF